MDKRAGQSAANFPLSLSELPSAMDARDLPRRDGGLVRQVCREDVEAGRVPDGPIMVCPYCKCYLEPMPKGHNGFGTPEAMDRFACPVEGCRHERQSMSKPLAAVLNRDQW